MTTTLPTLYKRNSNATAIQQWTISVTDATITTVYGQVGGAMQTTQDTIMQGKNLGKKNATTPEQQAMLEAEAQHEKKLKKGYVTTLAAAQAGEVDKVIEGGIVPMTALVYADRQDKVVFPVAVQPKLDGHRCVAVIVVDETTLGRRATVTLWTRSRKRIKSLPHIEKQLGEIFCKWEIGTYHLDGENYQHDYRDRFEELTSLIRPDEPRPGHEVVEYHIYDIVSPETFLNRFKTLEHVFDTTTHLKLVETHVAANEAALLSHYDFFKKQGYEGAMCRTLDTPYEHKRSSSLLKMKDFVDGEFRVVRLEEGRGKLQRHVGAFVCVTEDGVEFGAKGAMPNETLRQAWLEPEKWVGKMMTVKYFGKTADGSLRFPSALRLRDAP